MRSARMLCSCLRREGAFFASRSRLVLVPASISLRTFRHDDYQYESEIERRLEEERELARRHALKGRRLESYNDFQAAEKEYEIALKYNEGDPDALTSIAGCALRLGDADKALRFAERATLAARKEHREELVGLAQSRAALVLYDQGRFKEAQKAILEAQLCVPASDDLLSLLDETEGKLKTKVVWQSVTDEDLQRQRSYLTEVVGEAPVEVRISESKGRGLFATRDIEEGEAIFSEAPIVATASWGNASPHFCFVSLQPLGEPEFRFASKETRELFNRMSEHEQQALKQQLLERMQLPSSTPRKCSQCGIARFSDENAESFARETFLSSLCSKQCASDEEIKALLPSVFAPQSLPKAEGGEPLLIHHEIVALELVTLLVARLNNSPDLWDNFVKYLLYAEKRPFRALLDNERQVLGILQKKFPDLDWLLTERTFMRLKSMIYLNSFSFTAHSLKLIVDTQQVEEVQEGETDSELTVRLDVGEQEVHGAALFQLASLLNHSCSPNVERAWPPTSARATWIASEKIYEGDELTIEYIALEEAGSAKLRRQVLLNKYGFVCFGTCEECSLPKEEQTLHRSVEFD